ncbi:MAG: DUF1801 domain-containing protein [Burkholderiales bacterium]|nr:DUF1801 domain-containing protein [Burkholderiales bacterium]
MDSLFRFPAAVARDPEVDTWMCTHPGELGATALYWFDIIRNSGADIRELLHDGHPTACVGEAAFAYVNAFSAHVNIGFFRGAELADPMRILEGTGRFMRHVKLRPGQAVNETALKALIQAAYEDMKARLVTDR